MRQGIEAAFFGTIGGEIELKTSKAGKPWAASSVGVAVGQDDNGRDTLQWVRVTVFGETAERLANTAKKYDRIYCEGALKLDEWTAKDGTKRHGLSLAAWKAERVGVSAIGRNRVKRNEAAKPEMGEERDFFPG